MLQRERVRSNSWTINNYFNITLFFSAAFEDENQVRISHYADDPVGLAKHHARKDIAQKEKEFEDVVKQRKQSFGPDWGLKSFNKHQHPLTVIVS